MKTIIKKYFELKAGEKSCPQKGFVQHHGECWHDSLSMIILFTNELSNNIQEVLIVGYQIHLK
mgnify:CR=1 FL=1